jgi:hypothetical protein
MKVKEYISTHQGLWNLLGGITYEIDEENKCVNIIDSRTLISYKWCEDRPNQIDITNTIKDTRKHYDFLKDVTTN